MALFFLFFNRNQNLDLVRQLDKVKTAEVAERLNPIRNTLKTEKEALQASQKPEQGRAPEKRTSPPNRLKMGFRHSSKNTARTSEKVNRQQSGTII